MSLAVTASAWVAPRDLAAVMLFLASDEAPFINASCITVDGGRSALYHD